MKNKMKIKKIFKARPGAPFSKNDAQAIGEELENIKSHTTLNPPAIVERATNHKSVLHKYFDWDNSVAAEKWRLNQARDIANHVLEVSIIRGEEVEHRAVFSVVAKNGSNEYVSFSEAIRNPTYKKQLLKDMEGTLENLLRLIKLFSSMEYTCRIC